MVLRHPNFKLVESPVLSENIFITETLNYFISEEGDLFFVTENSLPNPEDLIRIDVFELNCEEKIVASTIFNRDSGLIICQNLYWYDNYPLELIERYIELEYLRDCHGD